MLYGKKGARTAVRILGDELMAYNFVHDVTLPGSSGPPLGFVMYPQPETAGDRIDSLDPDSFKYEITVREIASANG